MNSRMMGALGAVGLGIGAAVWFGVLGRADAPATIAQQDATPGAAMVEVTLPEALSARAQTGEGYYNAVCAVCHGANAAGQDGVAPPLVHRIYEPSHHGDAAFVLAAQNGVRAHHWPFGNMPRIDPPLTSGELAAIIIYVRELQQANGIH